MVFSRLQKVIIALFSVIGIFTMLMTAVLFGVTTGLISSSEWHMEQVLENYEPVLPTRIYDRKGRLISEFYGNQNRKILSARDLPAHVIYALISREDRNFFRHRGLDAAGFSRAFLFRLIGQNRGGGSSLTQQTSGMIFCDRSEITYSRKIKELWYAFLMEEFYSKEQILEQYMNDATLGYGTNGFEAASNFYFDKPAKEMTPAEAAVLVVCLSNPSRFNLISHIDNARSRQAEVMKQMVRSGYLTKEESDASFNEFWDSYDYTRFVNGSSYEANEKQAPYFSEYVRIQLTKMLYGSTDINTDGFIVNTSLDLDYQKVAESVMTQGIRRINNDFRQNTKGGNERDLSGLLPILTSLAYVTDIPALAERGDQRGQKAMETYDSEINPLLHLVSLLVSEPGLHYSTADRAQYLRRTNERNTVEGAFICVENGTGAILAMVGGSDFLTKENNRATNAMVTPGSSIKPLIYSAGISAKVITPATYLSDTPRVYFSEQNDPYIPRNYGGRWYGDMLARKALAFSMNIPAVDVLERVGFEPAIDRITKMLGTYDKRFDKQAYPRVYPLALGIIQTNPYQMARAYSVFANGGKAVDPIAIVAVRNRNGEVVIDNLSENERIRTSNPALYNIMSEQDAYVMTDMLRSTLTIGTMRIRAAAVNHFNGMPMAVKTGTTDNWGDVWTVGFSPYMTTAIWYGFDYPGLSLGANITGESHSGKSWCDYMYEIHKTLPIREFTRPSTGLANVAVCTLSGALPSASCPNTATEIFIAGTQPREECSMCAARYLRSVSGAHKVSAEISQLSAKTLQKAVEQENEDFLQSMLDKYFSEEEMVSLYKNKIISEKALNREKRTAQEETSMPASIPSNGEANPAEETVEQEELDLLTEENPLLGIE